MLEQNDNWKMKTLLLGTLVGAVIGLGTGYLLTRTAEESGNRPEITTGDAIKASLGIIGVVRGIVALGDRK